MEKKLLSEWKRIYNSISESHEPLIPEDEIEYLEDEMYGILLDGNRKSIMSRIVRNYPDAEWNEVKMFFLISLSNSSRLNFNAEPAKELFRMGLIPILKDNGEWTIIKASV